MKTILSFGIGTTLFMYFFISLYNHTWDIMNYSGDSVFWFGCLSGLGWFAGLLVKALWVDEPYNERY